MKMKHLSVKFDPRSKLCTILFASTILMLHLSFQVEVIFMTGLYFLFILNGDSKRGTFFYLLFWLFSLGELLLLPHLQNSVLIFLSFLFVGNRRLLPVIMASTFAMKNTKISAWIAALRKCRLPYPFLIPLTVLFRFFPTVLQDFRSIRNAMKFRGIAVSTWELFIHPFLTMEYIIVPILTSAENTSLDLSAAALVRGISNQTKHTSVYDSSFHLQDYILIVLLVLGLIGGSLLK